MVMHVTSMVLNAFCWSGMAVPRLLSIKILLSAGLPARHRTGAAVRGFAPHSDAVQPGLHPRNGAPPRRPRICRCASSTATALYA